MDTVALQAHLLELEQRLLQPATRASVAALDGLVADDFVEIASSGRAFGKDEVLTRLPREAGLFQYRIEDFSLRLLGAGLALATYRATIVDADAARPPRHSLRSSLWRHEDAGWRMVFHQGTPIAADRD
ncbi:DUF4440 domain-containing protein [Lysobacter maris]|uniref:DUF4440 domain-containing protein n=1 Tax=Marilutibacter maris TaxID=1605891 RepID=A0A508A8V8_9GAMM|nr:DUF4440 domain-containing protein [Lysobacter maris]KAB8172187.1 DUF4440 domain-containing protein [Lysobacter maris]